MQNLEARTIGKVSRRLIPFLIICYFVAYLDRVNVGFAALTMNKALGLTATMFGFGSGVFFLTYFIFEVPSNLFLDRFGARKWIARIMISWGILSGLMAAIPAIARATGLGDETTFYVIRALLGVAEAGFFPGIIFYLTLWFPSVYRGRIIGSFMAAIPLSSHFRPDPRHERRWRPRRLAMALHHRGGAGGRARLRHLFLSHRPSGRCALAGA